MYIIPLLFAYTPFLSGDTTAALPITIFGTIGIYALSASLEGYGEAPVPLPLRLIPAIAGVVALWPLNLV